MLPNIFRQPLFIWFLLVLLFGGTLLVGGYLTYEKEHEKARLTAQETAHTYELLTRAVLTDLEQLAELLAANYLVDPTPEHAEHTRKMFHHLVEADTHVMDMLILNPRGEIVVWSGEGVPPDVKERAYYRHHLQAGTTRFVSPPQPSLVHEKAWFFALSSAIRSASGELLGVGVVIIDIRGFREYFEALEKGQAHSVALLYEDGSLLMRVPEVNFSVGKKPEGIEALLARLDGSLTEHVTGLDGRERIVTFRKMEDFHIVVTGSADWKGELSVWKDTVIGLGVLWALLGGVGFVFAKRLGRLYASERSAQAIYTQLFFGVSDGIFFLEEVDGVFRFVSVNPTCAESRGRTPDEMAGRAVGEILHQEAADQLSHRARQCLKTQTPVSYHETTSPTRRSWLVTLNPVTGAHNRPLIIGIARDNTKEAVTMSKLQRLATSLPGFVYQLAWSESGGFRFLYASQTSEELFGVTAKEAMDDARALLGRIHPEDYDRVIAESMEHGKSLRVWHGLFRMLRPDGEVIWVEAHDTPEHLEDGTIIWTGYINDISQRRLTEDRLRASEAKFRAFVESANDIIYAVTPPRGAHLCLPQLGEAPGRAPSGRGGSLHRRVCQTRRPPPVHRVFRKDPDHGRAPGGGGVPGAPHRRYMALAPL